jgi:hypothetical protein
MATLSSQYSRESFETSGNVAELCQQLAAAIADRMQEASSAAAEVEILLIELRFLGHQLYSWDSDGGEWEIWGGDYVNPEKTRIIVEFHYGDEAPPRAEVSFGPWPPRKALPACRQCGEEMTSTMLRLQGIGHGQVDAPSIRMQLRLGEAEAVLATCGARSVGLQVPALWCAKCNALWIRDVRAVGWTG